MLLGVQLSQLLRFPFHASMFFTSTRAKTFGQNIAKTRKRTFEKSNTFQQANRCQLCIRFGKKTLLIQILNHGASKHAWFHLSSKCYYFLGVQINFEFSRIKYLGHSFHDTFPCNIGFTQTSSSKMFQR